MYNFIPISRSTPNFGKVTPSHSPFQSLALCLHILCAFERGPIQSNPLHGPTFPTFSPGFDIQLFVPVHTPSASSPRRLASWSCHLVSCLSLNHLHSRGSETDSIFIYLPDRYSRLLLSPTAVTLRCFLIFPLPLPPLTAGHAATLLCLINELWVKQLKMICN